jgi:Sulfotransferase family
MDETASPVRKKMQTRFIFVVGAPRSGTTLLAEMLSSHPDICSSPETHYFSRYTKKYSWAARMMESTRKQHFQTIVQDVGAQILGLSAEVLSQIGRQHAHLSTNIRSVLLIRLLDAYSSRNNKSVCCEKTLCILSMSISSLKKFVIAMSYHRDPRAVW